MSSENVYLIAVADHIGVAIKHAIGHNQPNSLGLLNQNLKRGNRILEAWMEDHGGRILVSEGDTVTAELPGECLDTLPKLHSEVQDAWNDSVTIGIGLDLKEAFKACENGKKRGGKRIVFYAPEIEQHLNEESASESHDAKNDDGDPEELKELGLSKANSPSPGPPTPNQSGFSAGPPLSPPSAPSPYAPGQAQPSGADMPPPPSSTNAAAGLSPVEAQMREMAGHGEAEAARAENHANTADDGTTGPAQLKQGIARILMKVKEQAPVLEQLKEQAPEAYTAILGMVQVVATIGKQLLPQENKGEEKMTKAEGAKPVYLGWFLSPEAREALLKRFPPKHPNVFAHHATFQFGPKPEHIEQFAPHMGTISNANVTGYAEDDQGQAVTLDIPNPITGSTQKMHVTLSTANDPVKGKAIAPVYSNKLLANAANIKPVGEPLSLQGTHDHFPRTMAKAYSIESNDDVRQLRRSYVVEGVQTAPLKNTGINQQVNVQDYAFPTNKEELEPHQAPPPPSVLHKIRKAAMQKKATGDAVTAAPPGLKVTAGVRKDEWKPTHCETPDCPNPPMKDHHLCEDCNKKYPWPYRPPGDPFEEADRGYDKSELGKALPMPEEGAKTPPKASGSLLSRLRGDSSPQAHKYFHQSAGQAAHVGMDGKPEGKNVVRQFQSGKILPINARAETDTGQNHPVSALNPTDSEGRDKQQDPNQPQV